MARIGFHCPHEQHPPGELLRLARLAESAGFQAGMCSDHFHPWLPDQGESGYAWSWLGAALAATSLSFGTVCAPGARYHPAIIAQAVAPGSTMSKNKPYDVFLSYHRQDSERASPSHTESKRSHAPTLT